ncbi:MAG: hypothetical protein KGI50_05705 [Patescibacteria group bacterium]|nr:hypothetical protein [Patescibacteria group bacterium]MDE1971038.1 hypothetical protein [Patescibacteria group bacterium]
MKRADVIEIVATSTQCDDVIVATTGLISRELFERFDSERNVYIPGSMGLVSSVGLGIALCDTNHRVVIIDGDASLLMNLGSMVTIGSRRPKNLLHIVLDNGAYASCSEESSMSGTANFGLLAKDVGYKYTATVGDREALKRAILSFKGGPGFLSAITELGGRRDFRRPQKLKEIKRRFMRFMSRQPKGKI